MISVDPIFFLIHDSIDPIIMQEPQVMVNKNV